MKNFFLIAMMIVITGCKTTKTGHASVDDFTEIKPLPNSEFQGKVYTGSAAPGSAVMKADTVKVFRTVCASSIVGDEQPLIIIDGLPVDDYSGKLDKDCIESVEILRSNEGYEAFEKAKYGIIIVTTKEGCQEKKETGEEG